MEKLERNVSNTRWTPIRFLERDVTGADQWWLMRCICGTEKRVRLKSFQRGTSLSCGCYRLALSRRGQNRLPIGESARNQLLLIYRRGATRRGLSFDLTRNEFLALTSADCHYCGQPPYQIMNRAKYIGKGNGAYVYNGIDRKDSTLGYTVDNCVPCCRMCNFAKSDMSYADFIVWLDNLVIYRTRNQYQECAA
jgi:hypothetical protein